VGFSTKTGISHDEFYETFFQQLMIFGRPLNVFVPMRTGRRFSPARRSMPWSGVELFFKCENFQKVGAFKFRGACNAVFSLNNEDAPKA
jgi:hypothetical protein